MSSNSPDMRPPTRSSGWLAFLLRPMVVIPLVILLLLIAVPLGYRSSQTAGLPDIGDPFDVAEFAAIEIPPEENAFVEYRLAAAGLRTFSGNESEEAALEQTISDGWDASTPKIQKWLKDNRAALERWLAGTHKPDAQSHLPREFHIQLNLPETQALRPLARLAILEARRLEHEGDLAGARDWYRAVFRCGRHSGRYGFVIERLVGISLHRMAAERLVEWAGDPRVTEDMLRQTLADVQSDDRLSAAETDHYKAEYVMLQNTLEQMGPDVLANFAVVDDVRLARAVLFLKDEPAVTLLILQHVFANWLPEIEKPLNERAPYTSRHSLYDVVPTADTSRPELPPERLSVYIDRSLIAQRMLPAFQVSNEAIGRERGRQAALVVALAAQLFRREQGRFPVTAAELVESGILSELPTDPFDKPGTSLRYRRDGDGFVTWSIGPDGIDDGGNVEVVGNTIIDLGYRVSHDEPAEAERPPEP